MISGLLDVISPTVITIIFFAILFFGLASGYHVAFVMGFIGLALGSILLGVPQTINYMYTNGYSKLMSYTFLCVPMFYFMGTMLVQSGVTDALYDSLYMVLGRLRGGLAVSTVALGAVLAACIGVISAAVSLLTIVSLKPMIKRGYSKSLASGTIAAGGGLGILFLTTHVHTNFSYL